MRRHLLIIGWLLLSVFAFSLNAQTNERRALLLRIKVTDHKTHDPLLYATLRLAGRSSANGVTDADGVFAAGYLPMGDYLVNVSYIGYKERRLSLRLASDTLMVVALKSDLTALDEVVVTASESKGMTSSSVIDRRAMQHLQPSSFSDLLSLLPGSLSSDPSLTGANFIALRQVSISDSEGKFRTSSLGTSFLVDGIPLSANADMNSLSSYADVSINSNYEATRSRSTVNKGIDMRSISTDEIERVEFVRGIPSVRYGDLTSGMVKIERRRGKTPLTARFKADGYSKLFAIGKGWELPDQHLKVNVGIDYLDAKSDPTNRTENYQRVNTSLRLAKKWGNRHFSLVWEPSFDQGHTLDKDRTDPDADYMYVDRFRSANDRFAFSQTFRVLSHQEGFFKSLELQTGANYELEQTKQTKFVQVTSPTAIPNSKEEGAYDGIYLPSNWISDLKLDGKPMNLFSQLTGSFRLKTGKLSHALLGGLEWSFDKNYGRGEIYDVTRPPSSSMSTRPRAYSDIPASHRSSFFVEDKIGLPVGENVLKIEGGVRGASMLHLASEYTMHGKVYWEPRVSLQWTFPAVSMNGHDLNIDLTGGYGLHHKFPTLSQLYPDYIYVDGVQLNYYHTNPDYRRINLYTFKRKYINYNLKPARNGKIDLRLDLAYRKNTLSVTYFREKMSTAFRTQVAAIESLTYKHYIVPDGYAQTHVGVPDLSDLAYDHYTRLLAFTYAGNGSRIEKEGVELIFQSPRWEALKTRVTIDGAWLKTKYDNSYPYYYSPSVLVNDDWLQMYGVYKEEGGYVREALRSKMMVDTYIPELDLELSASVQCAWFSISQNMPRSETPEYYIDSNGMEHPYTEADKTDTYLHFLYTKHNQNAFRKERIPLGMTINLKASKNIAEKMRISLFVDRLLDYYPDYEVNGAVIRRNSDPYFGMELGFTL